MHQDRNIEAILADLTPSQRKAVTHRDGPLMVVAGAGSGKTRVVTYRIAYLLANGVPPSSILALTFTNKAAREIRERVQKLCNGVTPPQFMGTFHSICSRFLRAWIDLLENGRDRNFTIFDADAQFSLIRNIHRNLIKEVEAGTFRASGNLGLSQELEKLNLRTILNSIQQEKIGRGHGMEKASPTRQFIYSTFKERYERELMQNNALDFADLLLMTVRLLNKRIDVRRRLQRQFQYIIVDEYQDTNQIQYYLLRMLVNPHAPNIHVTGDPDQAIYSWRGADYHNILNFDKDYPNAKVVKLEENFRSTTNILTTANALIRNNRKKKKKDLV
ncbi:MAG: hypothetical protein D6820_09535, partial [Lentisphaerae bacterium]